MPLSVVDLYAKILPRTNCKECGFPTCIAFAGMVVSEMHPLKNCPHIKPELLEDAQKELSRNEQTFVYIHVAQGGIKKPTGNMKSFKEFPNTVSKVVSMKSYVEEPLKKAFISNLEKLKLACKKAGGKDVIDQYDSCDLAFYFQVFPRIPVTLLFWDQGEGFDADVKLLFDETIIEHLDIESIIFLSEHLRKILIN